VTGTQSGGRHRPAWPARGASWRDPQSGTEVHCCGAAKYMDAARGRVRAGQRVGQSALLPARTAWQAPAVGRGRGRYAASAGAGGGRTGPATDGCPTVIPMQPPRVHPTPSCAAGAFPLVRPLVPTSLGMPTIPLPSTLLGRTWGRGRCGVGGRQGARGAARRPGPARDASRPPAALAGRLASAGCVGRGREPGRAVGGSGDHGQPSQHDRRRGGVR
jgi:hypothetical protein